LEGKLLKNSLFLKKYLEVSEIIFTFALTYCGYMAQGQAAVCGLRFKECCKEYVKTLCLLHLKSG
jgi:hypothetical protein